MRELAGYSAASLRNGGGFSDAHELLRGGYTGAELRDCGFKLDELRPHLTTRQLLQCGFSASHVLQQGATLLELRECGVAADVLKAGGCSCSDMIAAGYDERALLAAGFTVQELLSVGCRCRLMLALFSRSIVTCACVQCSANAMCGSRRASAVEQRSVQGGRHEGGRVRVRAASRPGLQRAPAAGSRSYSPFSQPCPRNTQACVQAFMSISSQSAAVVFARRT